MAELKITTSKKVNGSSSNLKIKENTFVSSHLRQQKLSCFLNKKERLSYGQLKKTLKFKEVKVVL